MLAVSLTAAVLVIGSAPGQESTDTAARGTLTRLSAQDTTPGERVEEAARPLRDLAESASRMLPRILITLGLLASTALLARLTRPLLRRLLQRWERADAATAMIVLGLWIFAIGASLSVLAGDVRALVGSVGLFGLALSWSLQTPIESFTGWVLNSFRGYYHVGDRISVGDVFGDVYAIDVLTTTVWEAGGPDKSVTAAQPTGALITFPNSEVLRANIINYTRDFPYVWDEVTVGLANESDLHHSIRVFRETAAQILGEAMAAPASAYQSLLRAKGLDYDVAVEPQVFVTLRDSWTDVTIRYLVPARERRTWSTKLILALNEAAALEDNRSRIQLSYPRQQIEVIGPPG